MGAFAWPALIFVLVAAAAFLVLYRAGLRRKRMAERLQQHPESDPGLGSRTDLILGPLTPALAAQVPMTETAREELQRELRAAGMYRRSALTEYAAIRTVLILVPLVVAGLLALMVDKPRIPQVLIGGLIGALLGYSLPRLYVYMRGRARARQIERGLPMALDMLTLCLSAGQNLLASLQRVSSELYFAHPVLAEELEIVRQQAELHNLEHALQQFTARVQVPEAYNLAMILIQSERLGTDASQTLLEYAGSLRVGMRQRADAQANRTTFWMLFPTLLCLWIAAIIILVGPAVLEFREQGIANAEMLKNASQDMQRLREETNTAVVGGQPGGQPPPADTTP